MFACLGAFATVSHGAIPPWRCQCSSADPVCSTSVSSAEQILYLRDDVGGVIEFNRICLLFWHIIWDLKIRFRCLLTFSDA